MKIFTVGKSTDYVVQSTIRSPFFVDKNLEVDNINSQNDMYCECVAMYYIWKHCKEDIVGLEHYRRNFFDIYTNGLLDKTAINWYLEKYDVIMACKNKDYVKQTLKDDLAQHITYDGINCLLNSVKTLYGEKEYNYYTEYLNTSTKCGFNLFITRKEIFDEYAKWFFTLIDDVKKKIDLPKRSFGFISEFLLYGFFIKQNLHIKELPFLFNFNGKTRINTWGMEIKENYK